MGLVQCIKNILAHPLIISEKKFDYAHFGVILKGRDQNIFYCQIQENCGTKIKNPQQNQISL